MLSAGAERFMFTTTAAELLKMLNSLGNHLKLQVGLSTEYHFAFRFAFSWS